MKVLIDLGDSEFAAKSMIETLCIAQSRIGNSRWDKHRQESDINALQSLINQIQAAMAKCQECDGTGWVRVWKIWDKSFPEEAIEPCKACLSKHTCKKCKDRGYVPDWRNWDDYHGEPKPKACPDCEKGREYGKV
jgi:RecJ-like exonuclease